MDIEDTDFAKAYVLIAYFVLVGILALYAFSPYSGDVGYILARLTPHLVYIPLVLTALWYPQKVFAHLLIFITILVIFMAGFMLRGWGLDLIFTVFTSFIYLWVYFAILLIPSWGQGAEGPDIKDGLQTDEACMSIDERNAAYEVSGPGSLDVSENKAEDEISAVCGASSEYPEYMQIPSEQIMPLIESFRINDKEVLKNTYLAIEAVGAPACPHLINALGSPSVPVRENSARMLGTLKSSGSICPLIELMNDDSRRVHNAALQGVSKIGAPAVPSLVEALSDGRWKIRAGSAAALRIIGAREAIDDIKALLCDENHYVRKEAAKSLGRLGDVSAGDELCKVLDDEARGVRLAAVAGLGKIGDEKYVPLLYRMLKSETDSQVRERILKSLKMIGGDCALKALGYASLEDCDPEIRALADEYICDCNQSDE